MNEELNKKLAEYAGFTYEEYLNKAMCGWVNPSVDRSNVTVEDLEYSVPNFTDSLDDCFEWLVPKLDINDTIDFEQSPVKGERYYTACVQVWRFREGRACYKWCDKNPALALCKAIEKLIDGEK